MSSNFRDAFARLVSSAIIALAFLAAVVVSIPVSCSIVAMNAG